MPLFPVPLPWDRMPQSTLFPLPYVAGVALLCRKFCIARAKCSAYYNFEQYVRPRILFKGLRFRVEATMTYPDRTYPHDTIMDLPKMDV